MPLSEHEQRLLEEMERNLYHNDADFVASVGTRRGKPNYTLIVSGILIAILGVGVIVVGVILRLPVVGILGFIVMFAGALLAIAPPRRSSPIQEPSAAERARASARSGAAATSSSPKTGFMDRMNERWDKRQDGRDERE